MADVKIELNLPGLNQLMKSEPIQGALEKAADATAREAGNISGETYKRRRMRKINYMAIVNVAPSGKEALHSEFENNNLLKAVRSVGLSTRKGGGT